MKVLELWRYPVKSMQGERLEEADVEKGGLAGDRVWGVRDVVSTRILSGRRDPALLSASGRIVDGEPAIDLPDGTTVTGVGAATDEALSRLVGREVRLVVAADEPPGEVEFYADAVDESSALRRYRMPAGRFVDVMPLLLLTTASLRAGERLHPRGAWDVRRFRPNVLIDVDGDEWAEDAWQRHDVSFGTVVVVPRQPCPRCTIVTRAQPGGIERDLDIFKVLAREHETNLGMWTTVSSPGHVRVGDGVRVEAR